MIGTHKSECWKITKDHLFDPELDKESSVGTEGPYNFSIDEDMPYEFRMFDDDHNLCYEGVCSEESFDPLDDFGMPNAGCTYIQYKKVTWETL